jgi:uncharacterized protein (TIGR02300 family)
MLLTGRRCRGKGNLPIQSELEKSMSQQAERGTKRHCQNADCRGHFYDLNRTPIVCPLCSATFEIAPPPTPKAVPKPIENKPAPAPAAKADPPSTMDDDAAEQEEDETAGTEDVEAVEDEIDGEDDNTFLENESEEEGDVSGIVGTPAKKNEEEA